MSIAPRLVSISTNKEAVTALAVTALAVTARSVLEVNLSTTTPVLQREVIFFRERAVMASMKPHKRRVVQSRPTCRQQGEAQ